jgi:predicted nucleic acid-binding protein
VFGNVVEGVMVLNHAGLIVVDEWANTAAFRPYVRLDAFVVMPNHVHGIVSIDHVGAGTCVADFPNATNVPNVPNVGAQRAAPLPPPPARGYSKKPGAMGRRRRKPVPVVVRATRWFAPMRWVAPIHRLDGQGDTAYGIIMEAPRIVLDTNVLVAGLRSRDGASFKLLERVGTGAFVTVVTVPLVLEYEKTLLDPKQRLLVGAEDVRRFLDYLCRVSDRRKVHFLWRPFLVHGYDDMVLEAAVAGGCREIVTFNLKDFRGSERFGVRAVLPRDCLEALEVKP